VSDLFTIYSDILKGKGNPYHDERGRFTSGPGGGSTKPKGARRQGATRKPPAQSPLRAPGGGWERLFSHDHASELRSKLKPRMGIPGRTKLLQDVLWSIRMMRLGNIAGVSAGGTPANREAMVDDLRRFARELEGSIAQLKARRGK
jgi:hypothetical protein